MHSHLTARLHTVPSIYNIKHSVTASPPLHTTQLLDKILLTMCSSMQARLRTIEAEPMSCVDSCCTQSSHRSTISFFNGVERGSSALSPLTCAPQGCQVSRFECDSHAIWAILTPHATRHTPHLTFLTHIFPHSTLNILSSDKMSTIRIGKPWYKQDFVKLVKRV